MKTYFLLMLLILPVLSFSQEKVWALEECIEYAIQNNPGKNRQEAQNEIYKINHREAIAGYLPSLDVSSGVTFGNGWTLTEDPETKASVYRTDNSLRNNYGISSSLTLFDGFYQFYRTKVTKLNKLRGLDQIQEIKDDLAFEVMSLFFNVLYYRGTVDLAQKQLEESSFNLKRINRMEELGLKSGPDVTEILAKEAEDRYRLTQQENLYRLEVLKLKDKMNLDIHMELNVSDNTSVEYLILQKEEPLTIYHQALNFLPEALAADKALLIRENEYKASKSNLFPRISMGAGWSTDFNKSSDKYDPFWMQLKNKKNSYVNFSLSIPVFNRLSRISSVQRSKQSLIIAQNEKDEAFRQIYSDIEKTVADVNGLADQCIQAERRKNAMEDAHQTNIRKYDEGLISVIDLTTSANRLLNAEIEDLYTRLQYQVKYKLLQYYKGIPIY